VAHVARSLWERQYTQSIKYTRGQLLLHGDKRGYKKTREN